MVLQKDMRSKHIDVSNDFQHLLDQMRDVLSGLEDENLNGGRAYYLSQAREELSETSFNLRQTIRNLEDIESALDEHSIVAVTDQRGIIQYVNDKFVEISKYPREELIGQDHRIINSGTHPKEFIRNVWVTIANGNTWKGEFQNRAKDGSIYWVDTTIVPILNDEGKPYQYVAIRTDITQKKAQEALIARRATELETVTEVSTAISRIADVQTVLQLVSDLTKERFHLYHAHIYLLSDNGQFLNLAAGAGEAGRTMLERGHRIAADHPNSIVARAARTREAVIVNDVTETEGFLPNPLLPNTRAEMALPMIIGDHLIGVLDVQSATVRRFDSEDAQIKSALAAQAAIAVENARRFEQVEAARAETNRLYNMSVDLIGSAGFNGYFKEINPAWEASLGHTRETLMSKPFLEFVHPEDIDSTIAAATQLAQGVNAIEFTNRYRTADGSYKWISWNSVGSVENQTIYFVAHDISAQREVEMQREEMLRISEEANTRTRRLANEMQTVVDVSTAVTSLMNVDELLPIVVNLTKDRFQLYHAHIYLLSEDGEFLNLAAGAGDAGRAMLEHGHRISANNPNSIVARAARTRTAAIVNDVTLAPDFLPNLLLPDTRAEMALPMIVGDHLLGVLDVQSELVGRFDDEDAQIKAALAAQVAVAVENARRFQSIAEAEAALSETGLQLRQTIQNLKDVEHALDEHSIVAITDQRGIIQYVNDKFVAISQYPREELIGQDHRIINSGTHSKEFVRNVWVTIANGKTWQGEFQNRAKDGSIYWVDTTIVPFLNEQGKPYQYIAIRSDITAKKAQDALVQRRATELATVTEVSSAINRITDLQTVLQLVSDATKDRFNLYHAHIYLLSEDGEFLNLAAGAGKAGRAMLEHGHRISANNPNSIVARAARTRTAAIVNDVTMAPDFLPNLLLPDTRAEMALPMIVGDHLIGVLDVQSQLVGRFDDEDAQVKSTLAAQAAIAVENARRFEQVEAARAETNRLYNMSVELIGSAGFDGYFKEINPAWEASLGHTRETLMSKPFLEFVHPEDIDSTIAAATQLAQGVNAIEFTNRYRTADGSYKWISWNSVGSVENQTIYFVAHDISSQREVEMQREEMLRLAEERGEFARQTAERLREVDRLKSQFLANMSHELRTPMNSIIGYSEILLDGDDGDLSAEAVEDIDIIHQSGLHLLNLINEILDLAKIEAGEIQLMPESIHLERMVSDVVQAAQVLLKGRPMNLTLMVETPDLQVMADPLRLRQIVTNLVSNALKFTEEGSVTVEIGQHDRYMAHIRVIDSGVGISPEHLDAIFERFRQVDGSSTRRAGGTGLGLAITKNLIELLGGEITVESEVGKGSTFSFTVPLYQSQLA